jgi:hypothetical protein
MGVGVTNTITITYKNDEEEDVDIAGAFWTWRTFLCFKRPGADTVTYVPLENVRYVDGQPPS